ncbi:MAG: class I tRNA ligase family protein, partial [Prevotella sp.]|nr:class I tRNA ligase family protein [Prevotella sp.]
PVIEDRYVDIEFGTGCLKVTPAHDVNDYALGKTHNLEIIDIFNPDGTISEAAGLYVGKDRMEVRKQIAIDLEAAGLMEKVEDYDNKVGYSERNQDTAVEPRLCKQWFLSMKHMADIALPPVLSGELKFYPTKYVTTYKNWLENIQDWCISRQLWWGHRIPAYFLPTAEGEEERYVVALNEEEALKKAKEIDPSITADQLKRDEDALDTWFSSWLWPISLFDGINNPGNEEINYYYPTAVLVTGPDIIFFWVARMIMSGCEYQKQIPFRNVYFTGIVRDKLGRKMSKSLGNSPDPLELIEKFGADGVRMGMMLAAPAGNDILYDDALSAQGMNFCNKMWNAFRLVKGWEVSNEAASESNKKAIEWMNAKIRSAYAEINDDYDKYRLNEALMAAFKLFTDEFSGWYLEMIKPAYQCPIDKETLEATLDIFDKLLHIIHPFMPFITEELWQHIADRKDGEALMLDVFKLDAPTEADEKIMAQFEEAKQIISGVRGVRQSKNIGPREPLTLEVVASADEKVITKCPAIGPIIKKMAGLEGISYVEQKGEGSSAFMIGTREYAVPLGNLIDVEAELEKAEAQLKHLQGFLMGVRKKLSNERFVANAPEAVVALERKKESDSLEKIAALEQTIAELKKNS